MDFLWNAKENKEFTTLSKFPKLRFIINTYIILKFLLMIYNLIKF